jgi:hypothetical protein
MKIKKKTKNTDKVKHCTSNCHLVRGYWRKSKNGTKTWIKPHIAHNPQRGISVLSAEDLKNTYKNELNKCYTPLNDILGFKGRNEYDQMLMFWVEYWENKGLSFPVDFFPLMIKALIAVESSFNPEAKSQAKNSSATGLMQVTKTAIKILSGALDEKGYREAKGYLIRVDQDDLLDPIVNIAVGIRWLLHKFSHSSKKVKDSEFMFKLYHSNKKEGEAYAKKIMSLYRRSKK